MSDPWCNDPECRGGCGCTQTGVCACPRPVAVQPEDPQKQQTSRSLGDTRARPDAAPMPAGGEGIRALTTEESIRAKFYEHGQVVFWAGRSDDYPEADLAALATAGKLEWRADVDCIEGHTVWGGARTLAEAEEQRGRPCERCSEEERSDDPEDYSVVVRYVMTEAWRKELDRHVTECETCGGTGRITPRSDTAQLTGSAADATAPVGPERCAKPESECASVRRERDALRASLEALADRWEVCVERGAVSSDVLVCASAMRRALASETGGAPKESK